MFEILKTENSARRGRYTTAHGTIETPVFMNVGTQAAIRGAVSSLDLREIGCQVELSNTYHLHIRPGEDIINEMGGLHKFMNWDRPILTDSGGFQVFSLAVLRKITEEGVAFNSHVDGKRIFMGPEESISIQYKLGSDIIMAFDECIANPSPKKYVEASVARTTRWLERCIVKLDELDIDKNRSLFAINQGGTYDDIRAEHMKTLAGYDLPGYAIGGLAVGEETDVMYHILDVVCPVAPFEKPRYLMGVGYPSNIIEAVARGVDFFDCVLPSRNGRHGHLFTHDGIINLNNEKYARDDRPIEVGCGCPVCRNYSRAYIRHLIKAKEMLSGRLAVIHNLYFYNKLMEDIRYSIDNGTFEDFRKQYSPILSTRI